MNKIFLFFNISVRGIKIYVILEGLYLEISWLLCLRVGSGFSGFRFCDGVSTVFKFLVGIVLGLGKGFMLY